MPEVKAKNIYEVGEIPQLGQVPEKMYAWGYKTRKTWCSRKKFPN